MVNEGTSKKGGVGKFPQDDQQHSHCLIDKRNTLISQLQIFVRSNRNLTIHECSVIEQTIELLKEIK